MFSELFGTTSRFLVCVEPLSKLSKLRSIPLLPKDGVNYTRICSDPAVRNRSDVICSFPGPLRSDGHGPMYFWGFATMILTIEDLLYTTQLQSLEEGKHRVAGISKFAFASWMSKKDARDFARDCLLQWCFMVCTIQLDNSDIRWWLFQAMFDCIWIGLWSLSRIGFQREKTKIHFWWILKKSQKGVQWGRRGERRKRVRNTSCAYTCSSCKMSILPARMSLYILT